jgi:rubredoxin
MATTVDNAIHFTCPQCARSHSRGYLDGVSLFRCLNCGYVGRDNAAPERRPQPSQQADQ